MTAIRPTLAFSTPCVRELPLRPAQVQTRRGDGGSPLAQLCAHRAYRTARGRSHVDDARVDGSSPTFAPCSASKRRPYDSTGREPVPSGWLKLLIAKADAE